MNKTGLINAEDHYIEIPYYEINNFAKRKCHEYMAESEKNRENFLSFSKNYKTFEPYLDFLICALQYVLVNPLNYQNTITYFDRYIIKTKQVENLNRPLNSLREEENRFIYFMPCSDNILEIQPFTKDVKVDGLIMPNGKFIVLDRDILSVHEILAEQILNQLLIKNKNLYLDYLEFIEKECGSSTSFPMTYNMTVINYLSSKLGYIRYAISGKSSIYTYNSLFLTEETENIIESDMLEFHSFSEQDIEKSKQLILEM